MALDEIYAVLPLFMLMGILQKPTQRSTYSNNCLLYTLSFPETLSLEGLELTRSLHFSNN
jgi:hypothetical protein